jgi:S-adenosylmethionine synthetase
MGVREHERIALTVSCAFIGRFLRDITDYNNAKDRLLATALETASTVTRYEVTVRVNAADDIANGSVYLTVTGTSAEGGDDGQTGRGNRVNGLITPCRPMTLEALAGKNPVTHVGKLYNAAASHLAAAIVAEVPGIAEAECYLVSQIGSPVDRPRMTYLRVCCHEGDLSSDTESAIRAIAEREIAGVPQLWKSFLKQSMSVS